MLHVRKENFCQEYMRCGNATTAAQNAGYSKKTAYSIGSRLLKEVEIQARLKELKENLAETVGITPIMIANELKKIAFSCISDTRTSWIKLKDFNKLSEQAKASISEVTHEEKTVGGKTQKMVKLKFHSKLSAIEELNKMLGYNAPVKNEVSGQLISYNVELTPEEVKQFSKELEEEY